MNRHQNTSGKSVFIICFILLAALINSANQQAFTLQHAGVEAIVERGVAHLNGSATAQFQGVGDAFEYQGQLYAAKQPGQFFIAALPYWVVNALGLSYSEHFVLAASLVTLWTSVLMTAITALMLFRICQHIANDDDIAFGVAIVFAFGTPVTAYSGITHHDIYGMFFVFAAFHALFNRVRNDGGPIWVALAGVCAGFAVSCSMLALTVVPALGVYLLVSPRRAELWLLAIGFLLGCTPFLVYNATIFGHPLKPPNVAGDYSDTYPLFTWDNFVSKLRFYYVDYRTALYAFSPISLLGLFLLAWLPRRFRAEQLAAIAAFACLNAYVLNMETHGHCQYGPRYFLPLMPFMLIGLSALGRLRHPVMKAGVALSGAYAIIVCVCGALISAMYCPLEIWSFPDYLGRILRSDLPTYPLLFGVVLMGIVAAMWSKVLARDARN